MWHSAHISFIVFPSPVGHGWCMDDNNKLVINSKGKLSGGSKNIKKFNNPSINTNKTSLNTQNDIININIINNKNNKNNKKYNNNNHNNNKHNNNHNNHNNIM